jgi:hypothetical protein
MIARFASSDLIPILIAGISTDTSQCTFAAPTHALSLRERARTKGFEKANALMFSSPHPVRS